MRSLRSSKIKDCLAIAMFFISFATKAQVPVPQEAKEGTIIDRASLENSPSDSLPGLPFAISEEKRLSDEDIRNKKEGWYLTGLPEASVDPIRGFGIGASAFLFNNRSRKDPFFNYTPYRERYAIGLRIAQNGRIDGNIGIDLPYLFNTRWRLRGDFMYGSDPNWQYFGIGTSTLQGLSYTDKRTGQRVRNARFANYADNLALIRPGRPTHGSLFTEQAGLMYTDLHFNELEYEEFLTAVVAERTYFEGRMRLMLGYEMLFININHYDGTAVPGAVNTVTGEEQEALNGKTLITHEYEAKLRGDADSYWRRKNVSGYKGGRIGLFQTGLMWDTRDLEPDPSRGMFIELAQEFSGGWTGSQFSFSKHLLQGIFYQRLLPHYLGRTVWATRIGLGHIRGDNIPFTEIFDQWGSSEEGGIPALGGARTLRGYREYRFTGMVTAWANTEIRARVAQGRLLNQHLAFSVVPFFDVGRVWDDFSQMQQFNNFRYSPGIGGRIAWNQATILRFDYAWSKEDAQFFFVFGHTF